MQKGFTLIELLMSIAIIAILSAVTLGGMNVARGKSQDAKIKSQLNSIRTAAQSYNVANGTFTVSSSCTSGMFASTELKMSNYTNVANYPSGVVLRCNSNGSSYAVSANLVGAGGYWCVGPGGSKLLGTDPGNVSVCP